MYSISFLMASLFIMQRAIRIYVSIPFAAHVTFLDTCTCF